MTSGGSLGLKWCVFPVILGSSQELKGSPCQMVKVATSLDVPIKLLWPKSLTFSGDNGYTMLGLGDIVIPGMFVALALRYDFHRSGASATSASFSKPYFIAAMFAYVTGLVTTMAVMHFFKAAQPALLYLRSVYFDAYLRGILLMMTSCSPACILSFLITALARGEFSEAWKWSDEPERKDAGADTSAVGTSKSEVVKEGIQETASTFSADKSEDAIDAGDDLEPEEGKLKKRRTRKKN